MIVSRTKYLGKSWVVTWRDPVTRLTIELKDVVEQGLFRRRSEGTIVYVDDRQVILQHSDGDDGVGGDYTSLHPALIEKIERHKY